MIRGEMSVKKVPGIRNLAWLVKHELIFFFGLSFLITWASVGAAALFSFENQKVSSTIILIGAFGPAVSALLVSGCEGREAGKSRPRRVWWFIPVFILLAGIQSLDHVFWGHQVDRGLVVADLVLVALATWVITRLLSQRNDPHLTLIPSRKELWPWIPVALGLWPALLLASNAAARLLGLTVPANPGLPDVPVPLLLLESFVWAALFSGPLNEEPGWRGFALPRLQERFSPLVASLILGALWGLWHVPHHLMGMYPGGAIGAVIRLQEIPRAILFTWLYNRTKGNLLIVILFHAAINTTGWFLSRSFEITFVLLFLIAVPFVLIGNMWRKMPAANCRSD